MDWTCWNYGKNSLSKGLTNTFVSDIILKKLRWFWFLFSFVDKKAVNHQISGCGEAWYRAWFGSKRPWVQIPPLGPKIRWNYQISADFCNFLVIFSPLDFSLTQTGIFRGSAGFIQCFLFLSCIAFPLYTAWAIRPPTRFAASFCMSSVTWV